MIDLTAKEFLQQTFKIYRDVDNKIEQLARLQELAKKVTSVLDGVPTANPNSKMEQAIAELHEQSAKLGDEISTMLQTRDKIAAAISRISDHNERLVLEYRYLAFKSWRAIARNMNFSLQHIFHLHNDALKNFSYQMRVNESK